MCNRLCTKLYGKVKGVIFPRTLHRKDDKELSNKFSLSYLILRVFIANSVSNL